MGSKKISTDPNVHNAPEGWFPTSLSRKDKKLYVKYVNEYGQPGNRWVDGTPRNPMPEIREQDIFDSTVGSWNNPAPSTADKTMSNKKIRKSKEMTAEMVAKIAPLYNQETVTRSQPLKDLRKKIKENQSMKPKVTKMGSSFGN